MKFVPRAGYQLDMHSFAGNLASTYTPIEQGDNLFTPSDVGQWSNRALTSLMLEKKLLNWEQVKEVAKGKS